MNVDFATVRVAIRFENGSDEPNDYPYYDHCGFDPGPLTVEQAHRLSQIHLHNESVRCRQKDVALGVLGIGGAAVQYLVKVHCCGAHWIAHVPALDCWTLIQDKRQIKSTVSLMIADVTGTTPDAVGVDLSEGRAVAEAQEFSAGHAVRWSPEKGERPVSVLALPSAGDGEGWRQSS